MSDFPYPGLRPFKRREYDIFCGRDEFIDSLAQRLDETHFIAVIGESGCGKSSLVLAGLLNTLRLAKNWRTANMKPGLNPFFNLAKALLKDTQNADKQALRKEYLEEHSVNPKLAIRHLQGALTGDIQNSYTKISQIIPQNHNLLLIVDQFEELFRYSENKEEVESFIKWLLTVYENLDSKIYIVITMRSEFLKECAKAKYGNLIEVINQGFFQVYHLKSEELKEAIELPAKVCGGEVDPKLVARLLKDANNMGEEYLHDQLPILQHALVLMWLKVNADGQEKRLTEEHYKKIGDNLAYALTLNATSAYSECNLNNPKIVEILFRRISHCDEKGNYTRHPIRLSEIMELIDDEIVFPTVREVVNAFFRNDHRRFLFVRDKSSQEDEQNRNITEDTIIDITHESVIRQWQCLKDWADEEREWAKFYRHWENSARRWRDKKGGLWRELDLETAKNWVRQFNRLYPTQKQLKAWSKRYGDDFDLAWKFFEASKTAQKEEEKRIKKQEKLEKEREEREKKQLDEIERHKKELESSRQKMQIAFVAILIITIIAGWGFNERKKAKNAEQLIAENLFDSHRKHSALFAKIEDYAEAKNTLEPTYKLDLKIKAPPLHARNLLARFIEIMNGKAEQQEYLGAKAILYDVALSPDKQTVVAVGERGTVVSFDVKTGTLLQEFKGHENKVKVIAFNTRKDEFFTTGGDKKIILWSLSNSEPIKQWETNNELRALAVNPEGNLFASGGLDNTVTIFDIETQGKLFSLRHNGVVSGVDFSPNGEILASASYDNIVRLWEFKNARVRPLLGHTDKVQKVIFSPNGELLATSSDDGTIRLWNVETGKSTASLRGHQDKVFDIAFTEDGNYLASSSADSTIRLWDVKSGITVRVFQGHTASVTGITTDGQYLFTSSTDSTIKKWNTELPYQYSIDLPESPRAITIAPDGQSIIIGFEDGSLQNYSLHDQKFIWQQKEKAHKNMVRRIAFSPNGQFLASASKDNTAILWRIEKNKLTFIQTINHKATVNAVAFSPDNKTLLTASYDGQMAVLNLDTQKTHYHALYEKDMNSAVWDASGNYVLTANDNMTHLWKSTDLLLESKPVQKPTFPPTQETTFWAALSPDGQQVAQAVRNFNIKFYPKSQKSKYYILQGHKDAVIKAIFSPDSHQLASVAGNTVRFWDLFEKDLREKNELFPELFTLTLPAKGKDIIWDFDFRCTPEKCWLAVPLAKDNKKVMLYDFGKIYTD